MRYFIYILLLFIVSCISEKRNQNILIIEMLKGKEFIKNLQRGTYLIFKSSDCHLCIEYTLSKIEEYNLINYNIIVIKTDMDNGLIKTYKKVFKNHNIKIIENLIDINEEKFEYPTPIIFKIQKNREIDLSFYDYNDRSLLDDYFFNRKE